MNYQQHCQLLDVLNLEGEVWRDIKGFEGFYKVSNMGRIKSLARMVQMRNQSTSYLVPKDDKILKCSLDTNGYPQVILSQPVKQQIRIHQVVAEHFLEPPSEDIVKECRAAGLDYVLINHKDSDRANPEVKNLEWCTPAYNLKYEGVRVGIPSMSGSNSVNAILNEQDVLEILRLLSEGVLSQEKIADKFGVKQITISNIKCGRSWSHFTGIPRTDRIRRKIERVTKSLSEQRFS